MNVVKVGISGLPAADLAVEEYLLEYRPADNSTGIKVKAGGVWYQVTLDDKQEFMIVATILQSGQVSITAGGFIRGTG